MAVYVGIDVHKHFCQAAIMNENGKLVHELRFDNNTEGAHSLVNLAKSINPHVKAVVEPSANYWIKVYDKLEDESVKIKLSNPLRTKAIAEARIKTDRSDAKTLAYLLRGDLVAESYVPTRKNRERRALIRHRASLMRMRVKITNRIHALLESGTVIFRSIGQDFRQRRTRTIPTTSARIRTGPVFPGNSGTMSKSHGQMC